jgi:putative transcription factor
MMICELCGNNAPFLKDTVIEGTRLMVCPGCAKMGTRFREEQKEIPKSLIEERLQRRTERAKPRDIYRNMEQTLADDYPERIKSARQKMGLTREEMGRRTNEKASVIGKLENGNLHPDDALRKKIEKFLGISLLTRATTAVQTHHTQSKGMTLGDFIKIRKEKKG